MRPVDPAAPRPRDTFDFHPLEVIPFFQRFAPSVPRDIAYTFLWNCVIGLLFWSTTLLFSPEKATARLFFWNIVMANAIGYTIHALFIVGTRTGLERRARAGGHLPMVLYYAGLSTSGVVLGFLAVSAALGVPTTRWLSNARWIGVLAASSVVISTILASIFFARERSARAEAELEREKARVGQVEREAALANLRALQAQIEPHFLFNTLANVTSLIDPDPAKAKRMLESFNLFLRSSLAATRNETTTLGEEATLIAAYLDVLQVRMGARLAYSVDVPTALAAFSIAPMLLQPVVENAIKHGLEPKIDGGSVSFRVREEAGHVVIEIADTGVGFAPTTRGGVGLTNLRGRLALLYGSDASLEISEVRPAGTRVRVSLPR